MITEPSDCPFCNPNREILLDDEYCFAIYDLYPVNEGHALVIPKSHEDDFFYLDPFYEDHCWAMVHKVKVLLDERFKPHGYNVGINVGVAGGQTIGHVHIHVIPRYSGDVENPVGGVRNVIPGKGSYK